METNSYWNGLYCLDYQLADFTKKNKEEVVTLISQVALKLLDGELAGRLEKLQGCGSYSVRVNGKGRMKFTTTKVKDVPYLLFLEYLPNHEYHRSKFNDPQIVQSAKGLPLKGEPITINILLGIDNNIKEKPAIEEITYYRGQDIILTKKQAEIRDETMPMIVLGQPGSGKTCIASQLILNYVTSRAQLRNQVLYLTNSKHLAEEMKENYEKSPEKPSESLCKVSFIDYESFLRLHFGKEIEDFSFAARDDFDKWIHSQKIKIAAEDLYQEFPLIFFNETLEKYQKLGKKQCLIQDSKQKEEAKNLLSEYLKYLKSRKLIDKRLFSPQCELPKFDFVVIDEAQGFAQTQVQLLSRLSVNNQHAFLLDTKQNQYSSLPVRQHIVEILKKAPSRLSYQTIRVGREFSQLASCLKSRQCIANAW